MASGGSRELRSDPNAREPRTVMVLPCVSVRHQLPKEMEEQKDTVYKELEACIFQRQ